MQIPHVYGLKLVTVNCHVSQLVLLSRKPVTLGSNLFRSVSRKRVRSDSSEESEEFMMR